jgi:DGQHR domain-containing protein
MARGSSNPDLEPTSPIDAVFGAYEIGRFRIPYLSAVLTARQCADYLAIASDDPAFTLANGRVEELFQRDIDEERVADMARQYLNPEVAKRPAFFNSITVALLVREDSSSPAPEKAASDSNQNSKTFGPIRVSWEVSSADGLPRLGSFGCLYWNQLGVHAVAIDGQHRLEALKRLVSPAVTGPRSLGVSILFLLLDPRFGVKADESRPVELMRQLFIDLNKHAQKVSRARQLLLDDLDPTAIALRATVGSELNYEPLILTDALPTGRNGEFESRLPLELVDWHGEQRAKVDAGPYATSVLALEWALINLCASKRFNRKVLTSSTLYAESTASDEGDSEDEDTYYDRIRQILRPWATDITTLEGSILAAEQADVAFSLSSGELREMGRIIHEQWGSALTWLLTRSGPYRRLAEFRVRECLLSAKFGTWYQASQAVQAASPGAKPVLKSKLDSIKNELTLREGAARVASFAQSVSHIEERIKSVALPNAESEPHLLFFLTGQRSMVLALRWMFDCGVESAASAQKVAELLGWPAPTTRGAEALVFAKVIAAAIDYWDQVDRGVVFTRSVRCSRCGRFPSSLWQGSILKRENPSMVDFSGIAAERGARMLYLMTAAWLYGKTDIRDPMPALRAWCKSGRATDLAPIESSASGRHFKRALINAAGFDQFGNPGHDGNKFPFAFLAKMKIADQPEFDSDELRELVRNRVEWIWKRARADA